MTLPCPPRGGNEGVVVVGGCGERGGTSGRAWLTSALKRGRPLPRRQGSFRTKLRVPRERREKFVVRGGRKRPTFPGTFGSWSAAPALPRRPLARSQGCPPCLPCPTGALPRGHPSAPSGSRLSFPPSPGWVAGPAARLLGRAWMRARAGRPLARDFAGGFATRHQPLLAWASAAAPRLGSSRGARNQTPPWARRVCLQGSWRAACRLPAALRRESSRSSPMNLYLRRGGGKTRL